MKSHTSVPTAPLAKGLGVIIGEIVFGVNGPFLFERYGFNVPVAVAIAVMIGALVGYCVAALVLAMRHRERVSTQVAHGLPANLASR